MYRFEEHSFDPATGELRIGEQALRLPPQPAQALTLLLERGGGLVTRAELGAIWPGEEFGVAQRITYTVHQVRAALGSAADGASPIETVPRRGYRFRPAVRWEEPCLPVEVALPARGAASPPRGSGRHRLRRLGLLAAAILVFGGVMVAATKSGRAAEPATMPAHDNHRIAHRAHHRGPD